jgi:membrane fusion protein
MDRSSTPLFRANAVKSAAGTQIGEPLAAHWRGVKIFTALAACLMGGLLVFVAVVEYSPVHRVPSYLDARSGLARLNAPISGQVREIAVREGSTVRKGTLLAVLGSDRLRADGGSQHASLKRALLSEQEMIHREIAAANQEAVASRAIIERRLAGLRAEVQALQVDLRAGEQLLASLQSQSAKVASLRTQGYTTEVQLAQKQDEVRAQESRVAVTRGALLRLERDIATSEAERGLVEAKRSGTIENRHRARGEIERLMVQSDAEAEQAIRAPIDGVVSMALITPGQSVLAGQPLFTLAAQNEPAIIRLIVPARAVASVRQGQQIEIALHAYPREKFGEFAARVESVSDTPSLATDIQRIAQTQEPAFIASASFLTLPRAPDGSALQIKPGMLAYALVPIERRTVLEWLLEPMLRGFNDSAGRSTPAPPGGSQ